MKKQATPELNRIKIIPLLIVVLFLVQSLAAALVAQKNVMNEYLVASKIREAYILSQRIITELGDYGLRDHQRAYGVYSKNQSLTDSYVGITVIQNGEVFYSFGEEMPSLDELWLVKREVRQFSFEDSRDPVYFEKNQNNVLYEGITSRFDEEFSSLPIRNGNIIRYQELSERKNQIQGEQNIWVSYEIGDTKNTIAYVGTKIPLTDNDYQICFIFSLCFHMTMILVIVVLLIIIYRIFKSQKNILMAYYTDKETKGRNWYYFTEIVNKRMDKYRNSDQRVALVNISMDKFYNYVTCYGEEEGKDLVYGLYTAISDVLPRKSVFARFEGASFAVILSYKDDADLTEKLKALLESLDSVRPNAALGFSIGIYHFTKKDKITSMQAYNRARIATKAVESDFDVAAFFFDDGMREEMVWEGKVEADFEHALEYHEFEVYLQPKYKVANEKMVAAEALVRWNHPTEGFLTPYRFISILEKNGDIVRLDDYMLTEIAKFQAEMMHSGKPLIPISVNVSRAHFVEKNLAEQICEIVDAFEVPHKYIELELTESAFFDDKDLIINTANELRSLGFPVSLDDFGSGYSSLNSLRELPINIVKLDQGFFRGADLDEKGRIIIKEIIGLAKQLNIEIVAEGIEEREQVDFLADLDCDLIQGYYFAKPMPVNEFVVQMEKDAE